MVADLSETLFSPTTLLWLIVTIIAASILFGAMNRRRNRLTESLRSFVDRSQVNGRSSSEDGPQD